MKLTDALRLLRPAIWEALHTRDRRHEVQAIGARVEHLERMLIDSEARAEERWRLVSSRLTAEPPFRVVFLVHNVAAWSSIASVHDAMVEAADFDPLVFSIPRAFGGVGALGEEEVNHAGLERIGVRHLRFDVVDDDEPLRLLERLRPDLIIRQSQWDRDVPAIFSAENLSFTRLALIPYEISNIVRNVSSPDTDDTAVDEPLHRIAWRVYCANEQAAEQAQLGARFSAAAWRALGHPKVDLIQKTPPAWPITQACSGRRIVLSMHHTVAEAWTDFGVFAQAATDIVKWARRASHNQFVLSPHPALEATMRRTAEGSAAWDAFHVDWNELPNTASCDPASSYLPVLAGSDVVVTDGLSALLEGQLFGKPVIWWERDGHAPLNPLGQDIVSGLPAVTTAQEAEAATETVELDSRMLADRQAHWVTLFGGKAESATSAILNDMRSGLGRST